MNATSSLFQDRFDNKRTHSVCAFIVCAVACGIMGAATIIGCSAAQQAYTGGNEAVEASGPKRSSGALQHAA